MKIKKIFFSIVAICIAAVSIAQNNLTPELLWQLGRVGAVGISKDNKNVVYNVTTYNTQDNTNATKTYMVPISGGNATLVTNIDSLVTNDKVSPDGKYIISNEMVKLKKVTGGDYYPSLTKSNAYIFDNLNYRHWDKWNDGKFDHVMLSTYDSGKAGNKKDIMQNEMYDCPTKPMGGPDDYVWSNDGKQIVYVCKKEYGTAYTISTNSDLYAYNIETGKTTDLTEDNKGYDIHPSYNQKGVLAWLSMKTAGYEADKQDIIVSDGVSKMNLTGSNDLIQVNTFKWGNDNRTIFFLSAVNGTEQLYSVKYVGLTKTEPLMQKITVIRQITKGDFDITNIVGQVDNSLIVTRTDFNHSTELYNVDLSNGSMKQITHVNDSMYATINMGKFERRFVKTTDGKDMLVWVIYPPGFDSTKKYPTLLYCQGGPQASLTQFYSFRWNFQLIAANGYIVVAPDRRGMAGFGTKWNEEISKDWGGQVMNDYLSAIDAVSKENYVDKNRLGCAGASYGGYSVYYLAGIHNNRFKTFIAHDGVFDMKSMYGTTDELWFSNWENGGPYWDKNNLAAQKSYTQFSPSSFVDKWNTPILIIEGGKDFRVPFEQAQQAFQAAQLRGIKSRFLYFPDESHWVTIPQDALVWQHEFFKWLDETLK
jgi:dipeptidyl aminopeptidase/acylaminoacyl peptidase